MVTGYSEGAAKRIASTDDLSSDRIVGFMDVSGDVISVTILLR